MIDGPPAAIRGPKAAVAEGGALAGDFGGRFVRPMQIAVVVLLACLFVAIGWAGRSKVELRSGDELTYFSLSDAVRQGTYREVYRPSAPLHIKYPPGYPIFLAVARSVVQEKLELIPAVNLVLAATAMVLLCVAGRTVRSGWADGIHGGWLAIAPLFLLCINRGVLRLAGSYYSESLFLLLSVLTLIAALRADSGARGWSYVAILLSAVCFLTRTAGIAMVAAIGLWLLLGTRRNREWLFFAIVSAAAVGGWFTYVWRVQAIEPSVRSYAFDLGLTGVPAAAREQIGFITRVLLGAKEYLLYALPADMWLRSGSTATLRVLPLLLLFYVGLPFGLWLLWKRWRAAALYLICYAGVVFAFPYRDSRLTVPAVPLVVLAVVYGMWSLTQYLTARWRPPVRVAFLLVLVYCSATGTRSLVVDRSQCDRSDPYDKPQCYDAKTRDMILASQYLAANTAPTANALAWRASSVAFLSKRRVESALIVKQAPPEQFGAMVRSRGIGYVVLTPLHDFETVSLADGLIASCADFTLAQKFPEGSVVLATRSNPDARDNACDALTEFRRSFRR